MGVGVCGVGFRVSDLRLRASGLALGSQISGVGSRFSGLGCRVQERGDPLDRVSSSLLGPVDPSFRALSGRIKLTVRRHEFDKESPPWEFRVGGSAS